TPCRQNEERASAARGCRCHASFFSTVAKGRLLSLLLTGGEAHDCPVASRLIHRTRAAKKLLGDKAYDRVALRALLEKRGTKPVIPNKCNRKQPFSFNKRAYKQRHRIENAFGRLEGLPPFWESQKLGK